MDPGTALAVASLSFQVFGGIIKGFTLLAKAHNLGRDATLLQTMLRVEESRLIQWARAVELLEDSDLQSGGSDGNDIEHDTVTTQNDSGRPGPGRPQTPLYFGISTYGPAPGHTDHGWTSTEVQTRFGGDASYPRWTQYHATDRADRDGNDSIGETRARYLAATDPVPGKICTTEESPSEASMVGGSGQARCWYEKDTEDVAPTNCIGPW
ncbi:hypothetical protein ABEW05_004986 [Botrytis cinerea]